MSTLIAQRPAQWNDVVGQPRAIEVLQAALKNERFLSRGIILHGVVGVGKTTSAYLAAKALMCTGDNHLGCGGCPSCLLIQSDGIDKHPDFIEIDGAVKPGVEGARETIETTLTLPVLAKRRVTIVDEAHWLSAEAWSAYLKTLEAGDTDALFLFVSQDYNKIQLNIRTRCLRIGFDRVSQDVLVGHLANVAARNNIAYDLDALKLIVRTTKGIVRDAVQYLNTCATFGTKVDTDMVRMVIDTSLEGTFARSYFRPSQPGTRSRLSSWRTSLSVKRCRVRLPSGCSRFTAKPSTRMTRSYAASISDCRTCPPWLAS